MAKQTPTLVTSRRETTHPRRQRRRDIANGILEPAKRQRWAEWDHWIATPSLRKTQHGEWVAA